MHKANLSTQLNILVTRPEQKGRLLAKALQEEGFKSCFFSLFSYHACSNIKINKECKSLLTSNNQAIVIFVSVAAVEYANKLVACENWQYQQIFAVGQATKKALEDLLLTVISPIEQNSEGLLALPLLHDVVDKNVVIIRGDEGRELLYQTLTQRGAKVSYGQSYQCVWQAPKIAEIAHWQTSGVNCLVITSIGILENMVNSLLSSNSTQSDINQSDIDQAYTKRSEDRSEYRLEFLQKYWQKECYWVVASERIAMRAKELGLDHIINAQSADNQQLLQVIKKVAATIIKMEHNDD